MKRSVSEYGRGAPSRSPWPFGTRASRSPWPFGTRASRSPWPFVAGTAVGALGVGLIVRSFLPQRFRLDNWYAEPAEQFTQNASHNGLVAELPEVEVSILRCGTQTVPEWVAVRGGLFSPVDIAHSAVLVRHPRATFLYDTGLCNDISLYLANQSWFFRKTLGNFVLEQSLSGHLKSLGLERGGIDFALLSHLHWDHVSGVPDILGVPLLVNRLEYEAAQLGLFDAFQALVRRLMGNNPLEFFDFAGPPYEGFRSSHDLFGDGSIVLVPLPGHTAGHTGMFINRIRSSGGQRAFLLGDAAWVAANYQRPATMHPLIWNTVSSDDATGRDTLIHLHHYAQAHPETALIAMHDGAAQQQFMRCIQPVFVRN
ncbi:MAG TPA: MBL fold metallo-hydrolase [Ktedonobacteraceae bacterium]|nr:MBL fold metallo-hydrolase [Ktedonobacteraceae bacterium]